MLKIKLKDPEVATSLRVKSIKASMHANSTRIHKTALLNVGYDYDVMPEKKHFIFVVDTSSSMKEKDIRSNEGENIPRLVAAKEAIFDIAYESNKKYLNNTYSIITFDKEAKIILDGGDICGLLTKKKGNIELGGGRRVDRWNFPTSPSQNCA